MHSIRAISEKSILEQWVDVGRNLNYFCRVGAGHKVQIVWLCNCMCDGHTKVTPLSKEFLSFL